MAYIHLVKTVGNARYPAWIEVVPRCSVAHCDGYQIVLGIHVDDPSLLLKAIQKLVSILNELRNEGYRDEQ